MNKKKAMFFGLAVLGLLIVLILPTSDSLPPVGQRTLAILTFAVILWVTQAVSYEISAVMIIVLISFLVGMSPTLEDPTIVYGTKEALGMAVSGFSSAAVALVAGALFLAQAMEMTGLHKRIALFIMSKVGTKTRNLVLGTIVVSFVLALFVPSATARAGTLVPILLGIVAAFGLKKESRLSALLMITAVQSISIWNVGIKTAAAQNMVALGFIETEFGLDVTWGQWFLYAAPWAIIMSIVLYFVMINLIKAEDTSNVSNQEIKYQLEELGKISRLEWRLIVISISLLGLWATEGVLHPFDSTTVTILAVAIMLLPKYGIYTWSEVQTKIPWGTLVVFATGISLGTVLLNTEGATWLSTNSFELMGLGGMSIVGIVALLALFNIIIHLGFASATSLASALIPIVIALVVSMDSSTFNGPGLVIIMQFVISFGFLLPISAPQNMLAYGTNTFTSNELLKSGIPITIIGYGLIVLFSATYWQWVNLL